MILITGAAGKTGLATARQLAAADVPFSALIRNPEKAGPLEELGADVVCGDIGDEEFLAKALAGITQTFLIMPNGEEQLRLEKQFTDAAAQAGVQHLAYLSSIESVPENLNPITQMHVAAEEHIRKSGMAWTMIRPSFFMQIFEGSAARIREQNQIVMPAGRGTIATTDLRDVAEVMLHVFTEPGHENKSYDLTGPELLTFAEVAQCFSEVLGRKIEYVDQPMEEFEARLRSVGLPEWRVNAVCKEFVAIAAGSIDHTTDTVKKLLGRPPRSLAEFVKDNADKFSA